MTGLGDRRTLALFAVIVWLLVLLAALVPAGFHIVDEFIYFMGVEAFRSTGGFVVENGYDRFASEDLRLWLLVEGPRGLVPQYPVGTAVLGAPLVAIFGPKGLIVLNLLAGIGTIFAAHALARRLFDAPQVATLSVILLAFCTFWAEYVVGYWPHSVSIFTTTLALWLFLAALDLRARAWRPAVCSGLAIGFGLLFRLEGVLALPVIAAMTILYAQRPVQILAGGAAGLLPGVGLMGLANLAKFGSWNPLSYGSAGGGTALSSYLVLAVALVGALGVLVALRLAGERLRGRGWIMGIAGIAGFALWLLSPLAPMLWRITEGAYALFVDATTIADPRRGVIPQADGTQLFWGFPKKALGQSLPWLGGLALLVGIRWGAQRRSIVIVLTFCAIWSLPFLIRSWHGGLGSNMRYFLPLLPALTALMAWLLVEFAARSGQRPRSLRLGAGLGLSLALAWLVTNPAQQAQLHQIGATYVFSAILALSLLSGLVASAAFARLTLIAIGFGLGISALLAGLDFMGTQVRRAATARFSEAAATITGRAIFYGAPETAAYALHNPDHLLAVANHLTGEIDPRLRENACAAGYRLLLRENLPSGEVGYVDICPQPSDAPSAE